MLDCGLFINDERDKADNAVEDKKKKRVIPRHLKHAISKDENQPRPKSNPTSPFQGCQINLSTRSAKVAYNERKRRTASNNFNVDLRFQSSALKVLQEACI